MFHSPFMHSHASLFTHVDSPSSHAGVLGACTHIPLELQIVPSGQSLLLLHPATCGGFCGWLSWLTGSSELEDEFEHVVKHAATITKKSDRATVMQDFILLFI